MLQYSSAVSQRDGETLFIEGSAQVSATRSEREDLT